MPEQAGATPQSGIPDRPIKRGRASAYQSALQATKRGTTGVLTELKHGDATQIRCSRRWVELGELALDVTVVIPTHNRRPLLAAAIESILSQRGVSLELVIVNDGSTDGTGPWLDRLSTGDPRIRAVHHDRPRRLPSARNAGVARAAGRWVAFCDDDDLWAPDKLCLQLQALQSTSARWGCTGAVSVDEALRVTGHHHVKGGDILRDLLGRNAVPSGGSSVIAETDLVREIGGFDAGLSASEDWDMWIRLAQRSPLAAVDRPLIAYRHATGTMSTDIGRMRKSRMIIQSRYAKLAAEYGVAPDEALHEGFLAKQLLRAGAGREAAAIFARIVLRHRRWRDLPRVPAALTIPRLTDRLGNARAKAAVPVDWRLQADAWLAPFREQTAAATTGSIEFRRGGLGFAPSRGPEPTSTQTGRYPCQKFHPRAPTKIAGT